jgi:hypothetical protein
LVAGADDRYAEHVTQDFRDMEGAVTFTGPNVDIDQVQRQMQTVEDYGAQDGAVDPGDAGGGLVEGGPDLQFVKVNDDIARAVDLLDDGERWNPDNADTPGHQVSSRTSKIRPRHPTTRCTDRAAAKGGR